jgi:rare lipoprotein A
VAEATILRDRGPTVLLSFTILGRRRVILRRALTVLAPVVVAAALAACSSATPDRGVGFAAATTVVSEATPSSTRLAANVEPERKARTKGYYTVGQPYRIAGKTYVPREEPHYSQVGIASWYGYDFHGRKTANGEIYDLDAVTAAHPTLPLPSYARVTNVENGRSIMVRINDRGPFVDDRIIDVSRTVARKLDFETDGTAKVRVDYLRPASLEADDEKMLLASYQGPGASPASNGGPLVMVAAAQPSPTSVAIAAAAPSRPTPMRTSLSFAEPAPLTAAQGSSDAVGGSDLSARLSLAAAKKASELGVSATR